MQLFPFPRLRPALVLAVLATLASACRTTDAATSGADQAGSQDPARSAQGLGLVPSAPGSAPDSGPNPVAPAASQEPSRKGEDGREAATAAAPPPRDSELPSLITGYSLAGPEECFPLAASASCIPSPDRLQTVCLRLKGEVLRCDDCHALCSKPVGR